MRKRAIRLVRALCRASLALSVAVTLSVAATTIPPDLEARADELRRQASPHTLTWVHDQSLALARSRGPIDLRALEQTIRSQFVKKPAAANQKVSHQATGNWAVLGDMNGADIEAVIFLVLMEAAKSAREDLKTIMDGVKAINSAKASQRKSVQELDQMASSNAISATPTPPPDRSAQLVAAARSVHPKTAGASLATVARR